MFIIFSIFLSLSIYILANPVPQNSNNLDSTQDALETTTDLVGSSNPGCNSAGSTNELFDELASADGILRRNAVVCPSGYNPNGGAATQTGKEQTGQVQHSKSSNDPCLDPKNPNMKLYTCGGPIVGNPFMIPWVWKGYVFGDSILNCWDGPRTHMPGTLSFEPTSVVAEFCCNYLLLAPINYARECRSLPGGQELDQWTAETSDIWIHMKPRPKYYHGIDRWVPEHR